MMIKYYKKRGYVRWTDENGVRHKVRESEFEMPKHDGESEDVDGSEELLSDDDTATEGDGFL